MLLRRKACLIRALATPSVTLMVFGLLLLIFPDSASVIIAYGVGGDVEDVGNVFRYDEDRGLHYLGYMASDAWNDDVGACVNFVLSSCALSPDGTRLAVGGCDRLACAFICQL